MRKFTGLFALLGLILLVLVVSSLLRVPPAPRSAGDEAVDDAVGARPPPPPTVTRAKSPPRTADAALELLLVDAVTREPVEGAVVTLKEVRSGEGERRYDFTQEGSGVYRLVQQPAIGPHALIASASGYECLRWNFTLTASDRGLNAEIRPLTDVVVIVEDSAGTPIAEAAVTLNTAGWGVFRCVHPGDGDETVLLQASFQGVKRDVHLD